ncbi:MAG TPA: transcription elongation factor GreA [Candidatus Gracilibacteria bacterium]|nr:transcription elongation factor GreA [Candidatus Gracilibacteria bacterium]
MANNTKAASKPTTPAATKTKATAKSPAAPKTVKKASTKSKPEIKLEENLQSVESPLKKKTSKKIKKEHINEEVLVTEEGLKKLKEELDYLENRKRREISARLQEAISYGDLSENAEYQEAKEEQAFLEGRIIELKKKVKYAKIIEDKHEGKINLGSCMEIKSLKTQEIFKYTIVGTTEVDPFNGLISNESPLGASSLGKKKGDKFIVKAPGGEFEYEVVKVS